MLRQLRNALLSLRHAAAAFKMERLCNDADGENPHLLGKLCNHRRSAGAGAAAHACGDKNHIRAFERIRDHIMAFLRRALTHLRVRSSALAMGRFLADLDFMGSLGVIEHLPVRIHGDKFHTLYTGANHTVHGVAAASAYADDLYLYYIFKVVINFKRHSYIPLLNNLCKTKRKRQLQTTPPRRAAHRILPSWHQDTG